MPSPRPESTRVTQLALSAPDVQPTSLTDLLGLAVALSARTVRGWTTAEEACASSAVPAGAVAVATARAAIRRGEDPLGDAFCRLLSPAERRPRGATYTPRPIIDAMLAWAANQLTPHRIVDPGAGSARFLVEAGRRFPAAELIAIEVDPVAALLARAHLAAAGLAERAAVWLADYRDAPLRRIDGPTLFVGNPPYVRHHLIEPHWKAWLAETARRHGLRASRLAGLHAHFVLATAEHARPGDVGVLITAAEWLDVNYGRLVRGLLMGVLGAKTIHVIEPTADPFPGTQTTAVITGFQVGARPESIGLRRITTIDELDALTPEARVQRRRLESADRWTPLTRLALDRRDGFVELGELCRVHRGQVTGANRVWVQGGNPYDLPAEVLFPAVTRARELFATAGCLDDASRLKRVVDLPADLDAFDPATRRRIDRFLDCARAQGADDGYIARTRKAWWSVGLREPAPILATYMARRPPVFVRNLADARHINIAHGLYPREPLTERQLLTLAAYLSAAVSLADGRTYAGGLTKFEPREMERLWVPSPELLAEASVSELLA